MNENELAMMNTAANYAGAVLGYVSNKDANETQQRIADNTNVANYQIAHETNLLNYHLWKEQLAYNDPTSQMERLRQAGLNPQLVMGNMQNVATDRPTMQGTTYQGYNYSPYDVNAIINLLFKGEEYRKLKAEASMAESQADIASTQSAISSQMQLALFNRPNYFGDKYDNELRQADLQNQLLDSNITNAILQRDLTSTGLQKLNEEIKNIKKLGDGITYENKVKRYKATLAEQGVNPDSKGMDYLVDMLIKNPNEVSNIIGNIVGSAISAPSKIFQKIFGN